MSHSSEKRWAQVSQDVSEACLKMVEALNHGQETFMRLLEVFAYAGGTNQGFAELMFKQELAERDPPVLTTEELAQAQDAVDAMIAINQLVNAANNQAVATADRMQGLRRMI